jgi:ABC-type polysaccharide/polyol phosphate transport system ATPase subunit
MREFCTKAVFIEGGLIAATGNLEDILEKYESSTVTQQSSN